jgi:DNA-binding NarL/FixJ family response regulator
MRNYLSAVLAKLGVSGRTQAAVIALRHGLVD